MAAVWKNQGKGGSLPRDEARAGSEGLVRHSKGSELYSECSGGFEATGGFEAGD